MNDSQRIGRFESLYGASNEKSRQIVIDAHGGVPEMYEMVRLWALNDPILSRLDPNVLFVAYAKAVDLGVRIGLAHTS